MASEDQRAKECLWLTTTAAAAAVDDVLVYNCKDCKLGTI